VETPEGRPAEESVAELRRLADTAGAVIVGEVFQKRARPDASTFLGKGKTQEAAAMAKEREAEIVLFDGDLSPAQIRNLEKILERRVVDRTELILDIFAMHAKSHQARLQVELAQAQYLMPRLKRMWTHLSREGSTGAGVGIGTRGPGEKQIEIDRRILKRKVTDLRRELGEIAERRRRMAESRGAYFTVSLVGYTNAGKSTLLRRLTGADALVADQLFSTLETQTRAWKLPGGRQVFLSDTVGFLQDLPHHLVASFYATLEEVRQANLLLHVVDASHPAARAQIEAVEGVLEEIGAHETPRILVLNKADRVEDRSDLAVLARGRDPHIAISAREGGEPIERLAALVESFTQESHVDAEFRVPAGAGKLLAFLAANGTVLERRYLDGVALLKVRLARADLGRAERLAREWDESAGRS